MAQKKVKNFKSFVNETHDFEIEFGQHVNSYGYMHGQGEISEEYAKEVITNTLLFQNTQNGDLNLTHEFMKVARELVEADPESANSHTSVIKNEVIMFLEQLLKDAKSLPYNFDFTDDDDDDLEDTRRKPF